MRARLPIIGEVRTGQDAQPTVMRVNEKLSPSGLAASFVELGNKPLSGEKSVSEQLIRSFHSWVYANVTAIAEEVSKIEFELYKVTIVRGEPSFTPVKSHPLLDLLDSPNEFSPASQFFYLTQSYLELTGDSFYLLDRPNQPTSMVQLQPDKVELDLGDPTKGEDLIKGYRYRDQVDGKNIEMYYEPELIIHIKTPNPQNQFRGKSPVEAGAVAIDTSNMAQEFLKVFFTNAAVPNFALTTDGKITDEEMKRMQRQLRSTYGGVRNAFKTLILSGGLKPVTVQQTGQQMQLIELLNSERDTIMAMFKNTKSSLGIVDDVNRANAEASLLSWKQSVIKPKMNKITDTLNEKLVPMFGNNLVLGFCDPVPEDETEDIQKVKELFTGAQRQVMSLNEAREILDLPPVKGPEGEQVIQPAQFQQAQLSVVPQSLKGINLDRHYRRIKFWEHLEEQKQLYAEAKKIATKIVAASTSRPSSKSTQIPPAENIVDGGLAARDYSSFSFQEATEYWSKQIHITEVVEQRFEDKIGIFIDKLADETIKNLHAIVPKGYKKGKSVKVKAVDPFNEDLAVKSGIDLFTPLSQEIAEMAGTEAYSVLELKTLYVPSRRLRANIERAVKEFTQSFVATDREKLVNIIESGLLEGQSVPQIERSIRDQFDSFSKNQTKNIARTETLRASNAGQLDAYKQSGVVESKQWYTARDERVCPECAALDGEIRTLSGDFFKSDFLGGDQPPLHPRCRCVMLPVLSDKKAVEVANRLVELEQKLEASAKELAEKDKVISELEKIAEIE